VAICFFTMNTTLTHLNSRRSWLIRDVNVWGSLSAETFDAIATEVDDSETRVAFHEFTIGGASQEVAYNSLIDHRGNQLPASLDSPVIIPIAKNSVPVAIIGLPSPTSFRVAKTASVPDDAIVDLWIIEAGN
jgi:hypothetical protein